MIQENSAEALPGAPPSPGPSAAPRHHIRAILVVALLMLVAFYIREWRIGIPPNRYFDEIYYVKAGYEYLQGKPDSNTVHPPLGKMLIGLGIDAYNEVAVPLQHLGLIDMVSDGASWRLASLIFGVLMVPLTFALADRLFKSRFVGFLAAWLLVIDPLHIVQSRIAMLDMFVSFFILLGAWGAWRFIESEKKSLGWAVFTLVAFSIGTACKWNSLFAAFGALLAALLLKRWGSWRSFGRWLAGLFGLFLVIQPAIYLASFLPFFVLHQGTLHQLYENHKTMVNFRYSKQFTHRYLSYFWEWPTIMRPVWYHYKEYQDPHGSALPNHADTLLGRLLWRGQTDTRQYRAGVVAIGSPFVWWTFLIFLALTLGQSLIIPWIVAVVQAARPPPPPADSGEEPPPPPPSRWRRFTAALNEWRLGVERPWVFLLMLYLPQVLIWKFNKGFLFYMLPCLPFMAALIAGVLHEWQEESLGRTCILIYLLMATLMAAAYYPLLTAYPIPRPYYELLIPTPKWV